MLLRKKILLILLLTEVISIPRRQQPKYSNNRHMPWNYTWIVLTERQDVAWSISQISTAIWWPTSLHPDLCKLALGAGAPWGLEHQLELQVAPEDNMPHTQSHQTHHLFISTHRSAQPGCDNAIRRTLLQATDFYVCPGYHKGRAFHNKCGGESDHYCASWGCETTGTTYWEPTSSWDYITVSRNFSPPSNYLHRNPLCKGSEPSTQGWCLPLDIKFTNHTKGKDWAHGFSWGLRLYQVGSDTGLTFTIKLLKEPVHASKPIPIGPNPILVPPLQSPSEPQSPTSASHVPTLLVSSPQNLVLTLVNQTFLTLNATSPDLVDNCWLCYHSQPPFYEGIAIPGTFFPTNDSRHCRWQPGEWNGLSLSQVSGLGLCVTLITPPLQYAHLCNLTLAPGKNSQYLLPPNDAWWVCLDGLTPCLSTETFSPIKSDFCILVQLVPRLIYYRSEEFFHLWDQSSDLSPTLVRQRREPISAITISVLLGLGAVGAGTGISSLVLSKSRYQELSATIDADVQRLQQGVDDLSDSLSSLAEVVLQNRRGLDLLFLQQGGLCAALREECCFYVDKTGMVKESMKKVREGLEKRKREKKMKAGIRTGFQPPHGLPPYCPPF